MIKALNELGIVANNFKMIKGIYEKSTINIIFNGEHMNYFIQRSGKKKWCPFSLLILHIVLAVLLIVSKLRKRGKDIKNRKEIENCHSADDLIFYIENPNKSTKQLLAPIKIFIKNAGHKLTILNILYSHMWAAKHWKVKLLKFH